jgi:hypothetical protein
VNGGWWRRNRWWLAALLPALVAAIGVDLHAAYRHNRTAQPSRPIAPGSDGWVQFAGARMRLAEIAAADLQDYRGRPYAPPPAVRVWRAEIVFDGAAAGAALGSCRLLLEDDAGRTFDASPAELRGVRVPLAGCTRPSAPATGPSRAAGTEYTTTAHFVTPAAARPVAVRVLLTRELPRYARLTGG